MIPSLFRLTCAFPYDGIKFGAKKSLGVVEYELHHHRLDAHLHERCRAAKTRRLNLPGPGTQSRHRTPYFIKKMGFFTVIETLKS